MSSLIMKITSISIWFTVLLSCNSNIVVNKKINGISEKEVLIKYGNPQRESFVKLSKGTKLYEYQSSLYTLYPYLMQTDTIEIKELFWQMKDNDKLVIWLVNKESGWIVIDNLKWSNDTKF